MVDKLLLPLLKEEQKKRGYISEDAIKRISRETNLPVSRIYGAVTFYAMLHTKPQGKNMIEVCSGLSCHLNNSDDILKIIKKITGLKPGQSNKKFSLHTCSCIGQCDKGPSILLNGKPHNLLDEKKLRDILKKCRS